MYEHLTSEAQQVIKQAEELAEDFEQEYVDTEHILLGIATLESGPTAKLLARYGGTSTELGAKIRQLVKEEMSDSFILGPLPSAPHLQSVLARAIEWTRKLEDKQVGTRHLLLAVIGEEGSVAYIALKELGVDLAELQKELLGQLA